MKYLFNERGDALGVLIGLITLGILGFLVWATHLGYTNRHQETVTVQDKLVKAGDKSSKYLVFTDKGVFQDTDALFISKWNSSDVYGGLTVGKTYQCDVMGIRNQFWSWYPNIVSCTDQQNKE